MRANDTDVRNLVVLSVEADTSLACELAEMMVNEMLGNAGLSVDRLNKIALMLACHFLIISQGGQAVKKQIGQTMEVYANSVLGKGLDMTSWGQMAQILDTTGTLAALGKATLKAQFRVHPSNPSSFGQPPLPDPEPN